MRGDALAAMPQPPLGDLYDHLISEAVTDAHVESLISSDSLVDICHGDLADALERAWLLYIQGVGITQRLKEQRSLQDEWRKAGHQEAARGLATQPKAPPKRHGDHAFIQAMWEVWKRHAPNVRGMVAYDGMNEREHPGRFQRFCNDWLKKIDPGRKPPSRHAYAAMKRRLT